MCNFILSLRLWLIVWLDGHAISGNIIEKNCDKGIRERYMWIDIFKWKNMKIFVSHVNDHQRITLVEEDFNNQMGSMTYSVDIDQLLFPDTPAISLWVHKVTVVVGVEFRHFLSNMGFYSPRLTCLWPLLIVQSPAAERNTKLL